MYILRCIGLNSHVKSYWQWNMSITHYQLLQWHLYAFEDFRAQKTTLQACNHPAPWSGYCNSSLQVLEMLKKCSTFHRCRDFKHGPNQSSNKQSLQPQEIGAAAPRQVPSSCLRAAWVTWKRQWLSKTLCWTAFERLHGSVGWTNQRNVLQNKIK